MALVKPTASSRFRGLSSPDITPTTITLVGGSEVTWNTASAGWLKSYASVSAYCSSESRHLGLYLITVPLLSSRNWLIPSPEKKGATWPKARYSGPPLRGDSSSQSDTTLRWSAKVMGSDLVMVSHHIPESLVSGRRWYMR